MLLRDCIAEVIHHSRGGARVRGGRSSEPASEVSARPRRDNGGVYWPTQRLPSACRSAKNSLRSARHSRSKGSLWARHDAGREEAAAWSPFATEDDGRDGEFLACR